MFWYLPFWSLELGVWSLERFSKTVTVFLLAAAIFFSFGAAAFAAENPPADFNDPKGGITGISNRGLWTEYPENSLEAILAAADTGIGYVLADVSETSDGVLVLMENSSAKRMLGTEKENVSDCTYSELASLPLKNRVGGEGNAASDCFIATLSDALSASSGFTLVLKFDCALTDKVISGITGEKNVILYITGKPTEVLAAAGKYAAEYNIITEKRSNIIFAVTSFIKNMSDAGVKGTALKTSNRYGVVFYESTLKKCESVRAVADTSDYVTAGYREDTVKWWDDLVSRGYSAVITDDPVAFVSYLNDNTGARQRLSQLYEEVCKMNIPDFGADVLSDYKKAYTDAMTTTEKLLGDNSSSLQAMRDCYTSLSEAVKDIQLHYDEIENGTAGVTVTLPRIIICVIAAAVVAAVQIYFYKRRKA